MTDTVELKIPDIGDFDEVEVIEVLVQPGDTIAAEQSLVTLESDKATMEVPSDQAGTIREVRVKVGDKVAAGTVLATLEPTQATSAAPEQGATQEKPAEQPTASKTKQEEPASTSETGTMHEPAAFASKVESDHKPIHPAPIDPEQHRKAHASPGVRRFARELGVNLSAVTGTGRKGRILKEDVQAYVKASLAGDGAVSGTGIPPIPAVDFSKWGETETMPLSRIRKISGPHLQRAWLNVPHVTQFDQADMTELEAFRITQKERAAKKGVKLTLLAFLVRACAHALQEFPEVNSSLTPEGDALILKKYIHIGVAVDTPDGLVVPVLKDADKKGIFQIAAELSELSAKAREKKLTPGDMQGGSFSISSLGGIGGTAFTPIVNAPEVAILGVSRAEMKPIWNGEEFIPRLMLPLSFSYDHRVIDGAAAVRFTTHLSGLLSDIRQLLL